jgi:hypothetical protein
LRPDEIDARNVPRLLKILDDWEAGKYVSLWHILHDVYEIMFIVNPLHWQTHRIEKSEDVSHPPIVWLSVTPILNPVLPVILMEHPIQAVCQVIRSRVWNCQNSYNLFLLQNTNPLHGRHYSISSYHKKSPEFGGFEF